MKAAGIVFSEGKMKKNRLVVILLILFAVIGALSCYAVIRDRKNVAETAGQAVNAVVDTSVRTDIETRKALEKKLTEHTSSEQYSLKEITNVLLIGVDNDNLASMDKRGNADGIMLVTLNKNTNQLTLTSFMRDTRIRQPHEYEKKITEIYKAGGAELLIEAIEQNFEVHIDNYILVNYLNVIDIIDALGGMDIELSANEITSMTEKIRSLEKLTQTPAGENALTADQAGILHLNGLQTAAYLRIRPAATNYDSGRTARARYVVAMLLKEIRTMDADEKKEFADSFLPCIETDMSDMDVLAFSLSASAFTDFELYSAKIPLDGTYTNSNDGYSYVIPDLEANNRYLYDSIYEGKH